MSSSQEDESSWASSMEARVKHKGLVRVRTRRGALSGLHTANLSWQTRVGKPKLVCVNGTKTGGKHVCKLLASNRNVFTDCFYAVHTHQLEFANTSLPT